MHIYATEHAHSRAVCEALAAGTGWPVVPPAPLLPGGVAMYGFLRGLLPTLRQAQREGREWIYADRGYFRATRGHDHSGYFRFTRGALQHSGEGEGGGRWDALGLEIQPWRRGRHILVCPPGDVFTEAIGGFTADEWRRRVVSELSRATDREIRIRSKPAIKDTSRPLAVDLADCHALVTYMSNTAVEALLAGVPVFCTGECAASAMGKSDLSQIERPAYPEDRERWARVLAANQWTLEEVRAGMANEKLGGST